MVLKLGLQHPDMIGRPRKKEKLGLAQALQTSIKITTPNPFNPFKEFHFWVSSIQIYEPMGAVLFKPPQP